MFIYYVPTYTMYVHVEAKGQFVAVGSFSLPCGVPDQTSSSRLAEPFCQPPPLTDLKKTFYICLHYFIQGL